MLWNRDDDSFTMGQWVGARVYERRCDLSPDGRHLVYFAANGKWSSDVRGSWSAVSRAPWMKAISLYPKGDCWEGGGLFTSNETFWLSGCHDVRFQSPDVAIDASFRPDAFYGGEGLTTYFARLQRDGWTLRSHDRFAGLTVFDKPAGEGWMLRKSAFADISPPRGKGVYWDAHELVHEETGTVHAYPDWEWAELDRGRLVWTEHGILRTGTLKGRSLVDIRTIRDFNGMQFERITAPY